MKITERETSHGPAAEVHLSGDEVAVAIDAYLVARRFIVRGARTVLVNGDLCTDGLVLVQPSGFVINSDGERFGNKPGGPRD